MSDVPSLRYRTSRRLSGGGGRVRLLRGLDELAHVLLASGADQFDRIGIAVNDALEELLAVLVGGQRRLRPPAGVVEDHGEAGVWLTVGFADLPLHALRERGR